VSARAFRSFARPDLHPLLKVMSMKQEFHQRSVTGSLLEMATAFFSFELSESALAAQKVF
jgi:hypothetical protein